MCKQLVGTLNRLWLLNSNTRWMQHQKARDFWQNDADILKAAAKHPFGSTAGNDHVFFFSLTIIIEEMV